MKLVVLAGAKQGAQIPLKKDRFTIGRSKECSLRAGSEAISRRHCELRVTERGITAQDLGSRNGTYVNDTKIDGETLLESGDKLRVGPLEFRFEAEADLNRAKAPKVKSVGEAVARTADKARADAARPMEDDISDWLISDPGADSPAVGETLSMRTDETREIARQLAQVESAETVETRPEELAEDDEAADTDSKGKKKPGKLPFRPPQQTSKDSREAAEQILREMARRR